jgi:hypothetical protein
MKAIKYTVIVLFALASVLFGLRSYGQMPKHNDPKPPELIGRTNQVRYYFVSYFTTVGSSVICSNFGVKCDCMPTYKELLEDARYDNKHANNIDLPVNKYCIQGFSEFKTESEYTSFFGNNFTYTRSRKK